MSKLFTIEKKIIKNLGTAEAAKRTADSNLLTAWAEFTAKINLAKKSDDTQKNRIIKEVVKECKISENTVLKRVSMINSAIKKGLKPSKFPSFNAMETAKGNITKGTHKACKNGAVMTDKAGAAKIEENKVVVQAVNENEILALMANPKFAEFKKEFEKMDWKLQNIMKALKS